MNIDHFNLSSEVGLGCSVISVFRSILEILIISLSIVDGRYPLATNLSFKNWACLMKSLVEEQFLRIRSSWPRGTDSNHGL